MLCQICGKNPASVHFTEIHDNTMSEIHVCERCAEEKGMHTPAQQHQFDIADLLAKPGRAVNYPTVLRARTQIAPNGETIPMGVPPESALFVRGAEEMLQMLGGRCVDCVGKRHRTCYINTTTTDHTGAAS